MRLLPVLCLLLCPAAGLHAQATAGDRFGFRVGLVSYGTGDDANCASGVGFGAGADVRSRGPWVLALGAELLLAAPLGCTDILPTATYRGDVVEEWAGVSFPLAPRLGVRAGRTIRGRRFTLEPAIGAGYARGKNDFWPEDEWRWRPWVSGSLSIHRNGFPLGLHLEYGRHAVSVRYQRGRDVVHEFDRWKPTFRIGAVF